MYCCLLLLTKMKNVPDVSYNYYPIYNLQELLFVSNLEHSNLTSQFAAENSLKALSVGGFYIYA